MTGLFLSAAHARVRLLRVLLLCGLIYSPSATFAVEMQDSNMAALDRGEYLAALEGFRAAAVGAAGEVRDGVGLQTWRQARVFAGVDGICSTAPDARTGGTPLDPAWTARLSQASRMDAIAEIVKRARKTRVVILNEAHDTSRGRAFGLEVHERFALSDIRCWRSRLSATGAEPRSLGPPRCWEVMRWRSMPASTPRTRSSLT